MKSSFILKGNICHTPRADFLELRPDSYVVCTDGICRGIFDEVPGFGSGLEVIDCGDMLILPGMTDLHIHAPQYAFRGTGMDYELMDWLKYAAFPEELRYADPDYSSRAYAIFAGKLRESATTRAVIFGTVHLPATLILMECMEKSGLISYVGKVNMDREAPAGLLERDAAHAAEETERLIEESGRRGFVNTKPIITPRFVPSCTKELMKELGRLRKAYGLPVQSHLSESPGEIELVRELEPETAFYGEAYDRFGLFGGEGNTVMAHCIYSPPGEVERIRRNGVWVAHCPSSNMNIGSGIAPVRRYLEKGIRVGLGTDVAGGTSESMFRAVTDAIQQSKLYWRYLDPEAKPLTFSESFYMATKGGGAFFGKAGSFEDGYAFDALVLNDSSEPSPRTLTLRERIERAVYLGLDKGGIAMKFAGGSRLF